MPLPRYLISDTQKHMLRNVAWGCDWGGPSSNEACLHTRTNTTGRGQMQETWPYLWARTTHSQRCCFNKDGNKGGCVRQMGSRCLTWSAFRPWFVPVSRGWTQKLPLGLTVCWLFLQYAHKQHVLNMLCRMHALLWLAKSYAIPAGMYTCKVWGTSEKFECPSQTAQNCFKGFKGLKAAGRGSSHGGHAPQRFLRSFRVQAFTGQC